MVLIKSNSRKRKNKNKSKYEIMKASLKTVTKQYCTESSIGGLKYIVDDKSPCVERSLWMFTVVGALICSASLVWVTFEQYYTAPLVTTQVPEGIAVDNIDFPAVGICSTNRISKKAVTVLARKLLLEERNANYDESKMLTLLYALGQLYDLKPQSIGDLKELHTALGHYDAKQLLRDLTPRCEDLLVRCTWNENVINCMKLFDFRLTMNGFCCTFNYLRHSDYFVNATVSKNFYTNIKANKSSFDYDQGLKMLLRFDESDDFYYNLPLKGAQLQLSDAYDFPDAPSGGFAVQLINPSVQMTVYITARLTEASRDIRHIPLDLRECLFHDESPFLPYYTHSDCLLKCRMMFLLQTCNCTQFNMPKIGEIRTCDLTDMICLRTYYVQSINVRPDTDKIPPELEIQLVGGGIQCPMCYPACSKVDYNYEYTSVRFYPDYLNTVPDADRDEWLQGVNYTGTSMIHLKYGSGVATYYGQNVIMKWFDLFSNIGSTCGLVTGFSFISVLEFVYFFTVKFVREVNYQRTLHRASEKQIAAVSRHFVFPVMRYRSIYWNELSGVTRTIQLLDVD